MSLLASVLLIGLLIFVHELGHLLAARAVGIPVARFSLGFGPVVWSRRRGGVEYCLSAVPLGGYVLPEFTDEEAFYRIPVGRRIVFLLGGPAANIAFAVVLAALAAHWPASFPGRGYSSSRGSTWPGFRQPSPPPCRPFSPIPDSFRAWWAS